MGHRQLNRRPLVIAAIPAYNEEKTIDKIVKLTQKYVDKVIVCDDGSEDMTAENAEKAGATVVSHEKNEGKGAALRTLFLKARKLNCIVVTLDADGQHDPDQIPKVIQLILNGEADIVVGSRFLAENNQMPFYRKIGNKVINKFVNLFQKHKITDTQSGYRAYNMKAIQKIDITTNKIGVVDSEILVKARDHNLKIKEIPITCKYKDIRRPAYNSIKYLLDVIAFVLRYTSEERPLLILRLPGTIILVAGLLLFLYVLQPFFMARQLSVSIMLISMIAVLTGIFTVFTAIILVVYLFKKLGNDTIQSEK